jgi:hypothetical protein
MKKPKPTQESLALAKAIAIAGGKTALMRKLNECGHTINSHNTITQWLKNGTPEEYCPDIEVLTGIRCEKLNPKPNWAAVRNTTLEAA